jgi:FkbM family methyltransferase
MQAKKSFKRIFEITGYTISKISIPKNQQSLKQITAEHFFDLYFSTVNPKDFFLIQLGANDGSFVDPLNKYITKYNLAGILIEPQADVFKILKETYSHSDNLIFENIAISKEDGEQTLYTIKDEYKKDDFFLRGTAIASFNKSHFIKSLQRELERKSRLEGRPYSKKIEDYIQEVSVKTSTLESLIKKHDIKKVDYLQIDCEGYDYEIIKMIDFEKLSPKIINFESKRLTNDERKECEKLLATKGYQSFRHGYDTCAFRV